MSAASASTSTSYMNPISIMNDYEVRRLENIKRNQALVQDLGIKRAYTQGAANSSAPQAHKKRKTAQNTLTQPVRTSARLASIVTKPSYAIENRAEDSTRAAPRSPRRISKNASKSTHPSPNASSPNPPTRSTPSSTNVDALRASWSLWTPSAPPPTRDLLTGRFHFPSHPTFTPNLSPDEMLRQGCFGGSYFRPLYSRTLGTTVTEDWRELPKAWTDGLDVSKYLTRSTYDPEVNKFKVICGQSIEEWEAAGWINHAFDVRGWYQWFIRFYLGRRCEDDERQIGRWSRCVGATGRWRRTLLKKYVALGIREVFDDGEGGEEAPEVSPVVHQTCHHWAFEVRQGVLDEYWETRK